jgi:Tol biopolymer transport system component
MDPGQLKLRILDCGLKIVISMRILHLSDLFSTRNPKSEIAKAEDAMIKIHSCIVICLALFLIACSPAGRKTGAYKIALVPSRTGQNGIFIMNSDSTGGKLLTSDATAQIRPSSWCPDEKKIAFFTNRREEMKMMDKYRMPLHFPLYSMNTGGGDQKRLLDFPVSGFEWSPDGHRLLYVSAYEDPGSSDEDVMQGRRTPLSAVYLLDLQSGERRRVTGFGQNCFGAWSPDGSSLALSFGTGRGSDIYTAGLDGKHTRRITESEAVNIRPAWSPDGKRIAYISIASAAEGGTAGAYVINADGTGGRRVGDANAFEVAWSKDGKSLLLLSAEGISLAHLDDNRTLRLTSGLIQPRDAVFAPDGEDVLFRSNHEGQWYLYAVNVNNKRIRRITDNLTASQFCVSPLLH